MAVPSGIRAEIQVAVALHPTVAALRSTTSRVVRIIEQHPGIPISVASVDEEGGRVAVTVVVSLGSTEDIKAAAPRAREATTVLARLVHELSAVDPILVQVPDASTPGAARARALSAGFGVEDLVAAAAIRSRV